MSQANNDPNTACTSTTGLRFLALFYRNKKHLSCILLLKDLIVDRQLTASLPVPDTTVVMSQQIKGQDKPGYSHTRTVCKHNSSYGSLYLNDVCYPYSVNGPVISLESAITPYSLLTLICRYVCK